MMLLWPVTGLVLLLVLEGGQCAEKSWLYTDLDAPKSTTGAAAFTWSFGANVPPGVVERAPLLLQKAPAPVSISLNISCGNTDIRKAVISDEEVANLKDGGFVLRVLPVTSSSWLLVADGVGEGAAYGCYEILQQLGFGFLHPLAPVVPDLQLTCAACKNISDEPYWPVRGWHVHTEHPLELTDFLQGFDVMVNGTVVEAWETMADDWQSFLDWCVANKISQIEYVLLNGADWRDFSLSDLRQSRLRAITRAGQNMGLLMGADAAIAITQQHDFALINTSAPGEQIPSLRWHLDWLLTGAGFDFLSTESGFSEFTHPDDTTMLLWMNETTQYCNYLGKKAYIKCHCSTGQTCPHYKDPRTGQPLNFNYLPIYADTRLGIMPHTVQHYAFDDPAPTYGQSNFSDMFDFMFYFMDTRDTIFHPETAYWVNYDIDVPLFLPIYAFSRVRDLRYIMAQEQKRGARIKGQNVFDSGWEWGYWLQDVVTSRAVWDPCVNCTSDVDAYTSILTRCLAVFGDAAGAIAEVIVALSQRQRDLLIDGRLPDGSLPADIVKHNAQAYLEGWDTWSEIGSLSSHFLDTQPLHYSLVDVRKPEVAKIYWASIEPLLSDTNSTFTDAALDLAKLQGLVPAAAKDLYLELLDSVQVLALRASSTYALYDYAAGWQIWNHSHSPAWRKARLAEAAANIQAAMQIVRAREAAYRVPLVRVAGWRSGPTAYTFGYLWTVHTLYYWYRDYAVATLTPAEAISPCFRNLQNPVDVALGEGVLANATEALWQWIESTHPQLDFFADCLAAPLAEPHYSL